jgi:hypothetical protein
MTASVATRPFILRPSRGLVRGVAQIIDGKGYSKFVTRKPDHDDLLAEFGVELEDNAALDARLDIDDVVAGAKLVGHGPSNRLLW